MSVKHFFQIREQLACEPRNNAVMTGNITTLRYLVDEVGVKTLNSDCKGYTPLQMAVVWGQLLGCRVEMPLHFNWSHNLSSKFKQKCRLRHGKNEREKKHCDVLNIVQPRVDILVYLLTRGAEPNLWTSKSVVDQARRRQMRLEADDVCIQRTQSRSILLLR